MPVQTDTGGVEVSFFKEKMRNIGKKVELNGHL